MLGLGEGFFLECDCVAILKLPGSHFSENNLRTIKIEYVWAKYQPRVRTFL